MPLNANAIVTLDELKKYLGTPDGVLDTTLESWINAASGLIEDIAENKVKAQDVLGEILSGDGAKVLYPKFYPIIDLAGADEAAKLANLQYRSDVDGTWQNITTATKYVWIDTREPWKIQLLDGTFPDGIANIKLGYKTGFNPIPGRLWEICLQMCQTIYNEMRIGNNWLGKMSLGEGGAGANASTAIKNLRPDWYADIKRIAGRLV